MPRPDPRSLTLAAAFAACLVLPGALPGAHADEGAEPASAAVEPQVAPPPSSNRFT